MDQTAALGAQTTDQVTDLFDQVGSGLTYQDFLEAAPAVIAQANLAGAVLAQTALNTLLASLEAELVTVGSLALLDHLMDLDRLSRAVGTCLEVEETARMRLGRLAGAEPVEATQRSFSGLMGQSEAVQGWTRMLEPDACQLCQWWAREGRIWPADHEMPTHKGCLCTPRPVVTDSVIADVSRSARSASADRRAFGSVDERRLVDPAAYSKRTKRSNDV